MRAAELRSLTKAAEASHICLAAASRRLALLEHRFKTGLSERSPRGVELTSAGASLLPHVKALLLEINETGRDARPRRRPQGALRILANTSVMTESLPFDLATFSRLNPDVRLAVQELWSSDIVRLLQAGEADVGVVVEGLSTEGLETRPYRTDRIAVVMRASHPLASVPGMKFADVLDDDLVALESGASMMRLLAAQAVIEERTLQLRVQVRSFEVVCRMVQAGLGIGILPFEAASVLGPTLGLVVRPLTEPWAERNMLVCVKKERAANSSVANLVDHLVSHPGR